MTDLDRFLPALQLAVVFSLPVGIVWAWLARVRVPLGLAAALSLFVILAATFSPALPLPEGGTPGVCSFGVTEANAQELLGFDEALLNVLLFAPFGFFIALHPPTRARTLIVGAAVALPFAIELVQLRNPSLGRYCDSMDIADNLIGLVLGFAVGTAVAMLVAAGRRYVGRRRQPVEAP